MSADTSPPSPPSSGSDAARASGFSSPRAARMLGLFAAAAVGLNLRPAITSVASVLDQLPGQLGVSDTGIVVLSSLPVAAFGLSAPLVPRLARRFGVNGALLLSMGVLALALLLRVLFPVLLLPGTLVAGAAIMGGSVLMPQYLKELHATPRAIGVATTMFAVGAALGAALTRQLSDAVSAAVALAVWALLAALACAVLYLARRAAAQGTVEDAGAWTGSPSPGHGAVPRAPGQRWTTTLIVVVFGLQAVLYFFVAGWLPTVLGEAGTDAGTAANLLAWFSVVGFISTMVTPLLVARPVMLRVTAIVIGVGIAGGVLWLTVVVPGQAFALVSLLGLLQSGAFGVAMSLLVAKAASPAAAGTLSALAQGIGFVLAAVGSAVVGSLRLSTGSWDAGLWIMAALALVFGAAVIAVAGRPAIGQRASTRDEPMGSGNR